MPRFRHASRLDRPPGELFAWHEEPGAAERLLPPWLGARVLERTGGVREGDRLTLEIRKGPFALRWEALHEAASEGELFVDRQLRGPFRRWVHAHRFRPEGEGGCLLEDEIDWSLPLSPAADGLVGPLVERELVRTFRWRHRRLALDLARHGERGEEAPPGVAVSGASGLVGSRLHAFLASGGHRVVRLVRRPARPDADEARWDPSTGIVEGDRLAGLDAVVHLAGENLFGPGWSEAKKRRIRESRVRGTRMLAEALAGLDDPPPLLVSASAIGYYGDRGDRPLDEGSSPGEGFLADVCRAWEEATRPAARAGIRVVHLRIGIVLSRRGGALATMFPPFSLGLGGPLGTGRQVVSWIALEDLVGAVHHVLHTPGLEGPVNAVAPQAVTNRELTSTLGRVLRRPTPFPLPASLLRRLLGEMAEETVLASTRAVPARLRESGFRWEEPELESALRWETGRLAPEP